MVVFGLITGVICGLAILFLAIAVIIVFVADKREIRIKFDLANEAKEKLEKRIEKVLLELEILKTNNASDESNSSRHKDTKNT